MIVPDAATLAVALGDDGPDGIRVRDRLRGHCLAAPDLIDSEVVAIIRRASSAGALNQERARQMLVDLAELPMRRVPTARYAHVVWDLSEKFPAIESSYFGLARALDAPLLTADRKLAAADDLPCTVELIS